LIYRLGGLKALRERPWETLADSSGREPWLLHFYWERGVERRVEVKRDKKGVPSSGSQALT